MTTESRQFRSPPVRLIRAIYGSPLRSIIGRMVLLLTTTGRKTGLPRMTPLQYELIDGAYYIGSARGTKADWFKNIQANPCVHLQVGARQFDAMAQPVTDACRIADFLEGKLRRHPRMVGAILKSEGLPDSPTRLDLEAYAIRLAMVIIHPN